MSRLSKEYPLKTIDMKRKILIAMPKKKKKMGRIPLMSVKVKHGPRIRELANRKDGWETP